MLVGVPICSMSLRSSRCRTATASPTLVGHQRTKSWDVDPAQDIHKVPDPSQDTKYRTLHKSPTRHKAPNMAQHTPNLASKRTQDGPSWRVHLKPKRRAQMNAHFWPNMDPNPKWLNIGSTWCQFI